MRVDTFRKVETPEGVELGLRVAGPPVRMLAWLLDVLIRSLIYSVAAMMLGVLGNAGTGLMLIVSFLGEWFYPVFFEVLARGATPGKKAMDILVLHDDGTPVSWSSSVLRNLLRFIDFLPFLYGFGLVSALVSRDFKRLGDHVARTVVVYRDRPASTVKAAEARPVHPPVPLTLEEQSAVLEYASRSRTWTDGRKVEVANLVGPLTRRTGADGVRELYGMASWLQGER